MTYQKDKKSYELARTWRKRSPRALLVECKLVLPAWETVQFPQEIKNRTYDAEVTLQSASPKETK